MLKISQIIASICVQAALGKGLDVDVKKPALFPKAGQYFFRKLPFSAHLADERIGAFGFKV